VKQAPGVVPHRTRQLQAYGGGFPAAAFGLSVSNSATSSSRARVRRALLLLCPYE
jgi:hypothetical protein